MSGRTRAIAIAALVAAAFFAGFILRGDGGGGQADAPDTASGEALYWTCSMHPQIKLPGPGKCPICFMDLIPVESGTGGDAGGRRLEMSEAAVRLAEVETRAVERRPAAASIRMVGNVAFDETRMAEITAWVPGRIEKLLVNFTGAAVRRGDPLAEVYSPALVSAQEELIQAKRAFDAAPASGAARSTLEAAREKLRQYGLMDGQIEGIEREGRARTEVTLYSPASGVVVGLAVREGQYVKTGTTLMKIADLSQVWIMFRAFQSDLSLIRAGQGVTFTTTALPGESFGGKVVFVDPVLDPKTMTAGVRAAAKNGDGMLRPDMFVSGEVSVPLDAGGRAAGTGRDGGKGDPLLIPATAPLLTGKRAVVYVKLDGGSGPVFEGRDVVLGPRAGDSYVVLSGLEEGELVVTSGAFKIDSELQIRAGTSMMSAEGGASAPAHVHGESGAAPGRVRAEGAEGGRPYGHITAGSVMLTELEPVYGAYFDVQMALAGDDLAKAVEAYGKLGKVTAGVDHGLFKHPAHDLWMEISSRIAESADAGAKAKDIAAARDAFYHLSKAVIELQDRIGHSGGDFFLTFCPMARDNAGAFWIQEVDTVYNSFYGAVMLRCGSIEKKLPPAGGE